MRNVNNVFDMIIGSAHWLFYILFAPQLDITFNFFYCWTIICLYFVLVNIRAIKCPQIIIVPGTSRWTSPSSRTPSRISSGKALNWIGFSIGSESQKTFSSIKLTQAITKRPSHWSVLTWWKSASSRYGHWNKVFLFSQTTFMYEILAWQRAPWILP